MAINRRLVESFLPPEYLRELGVYLQTCAQIEYWIASAICHIDGLSQSDPEWLARHNSLRAKSTRCLVSELSKAALRLGIEDHWAQYLKEESGWMHRFLDNRHIAVHGTHQIDGVSSAVEIDAVPRAAREAQRLSYQQQEVTQVIDDADRILRNLIDFSEHMEDQKAQK